MSNELTQKRLKELLHYDPETGVFTWKVRKGSSYPGEVAGIIDQHGYLKIQIDRRKRPAHRLAHLYMTGEFPVDQLEHKNGVRSDNGWGNLRPATDAENRQNMKKKVGTLSNLQGVTWFPRDQCWMSRLCIRYRSIFLGYFPTQEEAHQAYLKAKARLHTFNPVPRPT